MSGPESLDSPTFQTPADWDEKVTHPGLIQLHRVRDIPTQVARWKLFAWAIHPTLNYRVLASLDLDKVLLVSILYYIQHELTNPVLEDWEVKIFILQNILVKNMSVKDTRSSLSSEVIPSARSCGLATLFTRSIVPHINYVVGLPCPVNLTLNYQNFDGKLFQSLYNRAMSGEDLLSLCKSSQELLEEVEKIFVLIRTNSGVAVDTNRFS